MWIVAWRPSIFTSLTMLRVTMSLKISGSCTVRRGGHHYVAIESHESSLIGRAAGDYSDRRADRQSARRGGLK